MAHKRFNEAQLGILVGQKNFHALRRALTEMNQVDVAQFIQDLPDEQAVLAFRTLPKEHAMNVFAELDSDMQQHIITSITDREIQALMDDLAVDDAVDMLEEMPATLVKHVLKSTSPEARSLINQFLLYPENSAGSIMTAEFTDLRKDMTVEDAIKRIRRVGEDKETIYTCYVMDDARVLQGVVNVKELLIANDAEIVEDIMETDIVSVKTTDDREEAVRLLHKYDWIALPVVDAEGRLVGIVTIDDAVDVMQEETTEDFEKMAGIAPSEKPYLKTSVLALAKNRFMWLLVLMISGIITGGILGRYEAAFSAIPLLVTFIPMLTDTGGDAGSQASTLIIRGMAVGEIEMRDLGAIIWKEVRVSLLVALPLTIVNFVRIVISYPQHTMVALTVSLTLVGTVLLANILGGVLPIIAKKCKVDPALMAAPLISSLVDAFSLVIYFTIAMILLPI